MVALLWQIASGAARRQVTTSCKISRLDAERLVYQVKRRG